VGGELLTHSVGPGEVFGPPLKLQPTRTAFGCSYLVTPTQWSMHVLGAPRWQQWTLLHSKGPREPFANVPAAGVVSTEARKIVIIGCATFLGVRAGPN
jgi:hypothetical protein